MARIRELLQDAAHSLDFCDNPRLESEVLLARALRVSRGYLYAWPERVLSVEEQSAFRALLRRRQSGEPLAYILEEREFWSLSLCVTPHTLIPRQETELLVERALTHLSPEKTAWVLDLGTGSGAVALALAHERPACCFIATDCSLPALRTAQANARRLLLSNLYFVAADWLNPLQIKADLIVSNPPYIAPRDPHLKQGDLPWEPRRALVAEENGLAALRGIIENAASCLRTGGGLLLEHGAGQEDTVSTLLAGAGYTTINTYYDLNGLARVTEGCLNK